MPSTQRTPTKDQAGNKPKGKNFTPKGKNSTPKDSKPPGNTVGDQRATPTPPPDQPPPNLDTAGFIRSINALETRVTEMESTTDRRIANLETTITSRLDDTDKRFKEAIAILGAQMTEQITKSLIDDRKMASSSEEEGSMGSDEPPNVTFTEETKSPATRSSAKPSRPTRRSGSDDDVNSKEPKSPKTKNVDPRGLGSHPRLGHRDMNQPYDEDSTYVFTLRLGAANKVASMSNKAKQRHFEEELQLLGRNKELGNRWNTTLRGPYAQESPITEDGDFPLSVNDIIIAGGVPKEHITSQYQCMVGVINRLSHVSKAEIPDHILLDPSFSLRELTEWCRDRGYTASSRKIGDFDHYGQVMPRTPPAFVDSIYDMFDRSGDTSRPPHKINLEEAGFLVVCLAQVLPSHLRRTAEYLREYGSFGVQESTSASHCSNIPKKRSDIGQGQVATAATLALLIMTGVHLDEQIYRVIDRVSESVIERRTDRQKGSEAVKLAKDDTSAFVKASEKASAQNTTKGQAAPYASLQQKHNDFAVRSDVNGKGAWMTEMSRQPPSDETHVAWSHHGRGIIRRNGEWKLRGTDGIMAMWLLNNGFYLEGCPVITYLTESMAQFLSTLTSREMSYIGTKHRMMLESFAKQLVGTPDESMIMSRIRNEKTTSGTLKLALWGPMFVLHLMWSLYWGDDRDCERSFHSNLIDITSQEIQKLMEQSRDLNAVSDEGKRMREALKILMKVKNLVLGMA
ncbi:hypothetical protein TrRE_jg12748, partial [Triparma retinervis]